MGRVSFRGVTKQYGDVVAVKSSDLEVREGEFLVLVGPSGCGKSTSLRMIAGLDRPSAGQIFIGDRDVTNLQPRARDIAMVFQDYALYPHMTVRQNMSFGLKNLRYPKAEVEQRVAEATRILGLETMLDRRPKQLSGGQRQRVALGRAIVRNPAVFLLDEPLSNLDAKLRVQMRVEIAELQRRLGTTTVFVTHDQEEAMTLGHRIVVMRDGAIQQVDAPERLYAEPCNVFVARFIGSPPMNVFPGTVRSRGAEPHVETSTGLRLPIPPLWRPSLGPRDGQAIYLGIRAEDIGVVTATGATEVDDLEVEVEVSAVEMLGPQRLVYFPLAGELAVASLHPEVPVRATERLRTVWRGRKLHFFDGETEERLQPHAQPQAVAH